METLVKLKFGDGDFQRGFAQNTNTIAITNPEGKSTKIEIQLPSAPEIPVLYQKWLDKYALLTNPVRIGFKRKQVTNFSWSECYQECEQFAQDLRTRLNHWLVVIEPKLEGVVKLNLDSEIIFIIDTQDIKCQSTKDILHRLPWREWDYFHRDYCLETALTFNQFKSKVNLIKDEEIFRRVKITGIFGEHQNIDIETDRQLIEKLQQRGAELTFLLQPKRPDLVKLWDEPCDILFYSGHSQTDRKNQVGYLQINQEENLNPEEVKNTFREAITKGLKLAIFNSCDGLGLAQQLANLGLPYIIVWREAVPDKIAQDFLRYFLAAFSEGKSLFSSVRDARIKLQELTGKEDTQKQPAGVNWLPIICKNSLDAPVKWEDLGGLTGKLPDCPYKGLSAFMEEDAEYFFGREQFIADLVEAVNTKSLVPVVGASGSGKSSVVFAGLVPLLRETGTQIVSFRPGNNPFDALAVALSGHRQCEDLGSRLKELELEINLQQNQKELYKIIESFLNFGKSPSQRFVLIADQFEELYTLTTEEQRQPFLDALLYAVRFAPAFTLVLTLRADFYGHALAYRPFSDALQAGIYNLAPMNPIELRAAIEKPAHKMKVELEQGLTVKLIDDLGKKPGRLPLLEFTLTQLWQKPNKWYLTHQAYGEIGGLEKALAKYADSVLKLLSTADKEKAERVFIQLVRPGEGTEDTKRLATRKEVGENNWDLVKSLADKRLVVTGWNEVNQIETVEIIHEALIREWGTLREWIKSNREFRIWQERLKPDVREWENKKYDREILLQGTRLAIAQDWLKQRRDELTALEQDFINTSVERRDKERRKQKRRQQLTISGLVGGLMLVSTFAGISEVRRTDAQAGKISSVAEEFFSENDHEVALMEAIRAGKLISKSIWKPWVTPETKMQVVSRLREIVYGYQIKTLKGDGRVTSIGFSPDGKTIASGFDDGTVTFWDSTTGKKIKSFKGDSKWIGSLSFFPDGKTIITASNNGTIEQWDIVTGKQIKIFKVDSESRPDSRIRLSLSSDGKTITSISFDGTVEQWNSTTGKKITNFKMPYDVISDNLISPDAKIIVFRPTNSVNQQKVWGDLKFWDSTTGKEIKTLKGNAKGVDGVSFSRDGKTIALASGKGAVKLLDIATGKEIKTFKLDSSWEVNGLHGLSFSPNGKTIAFASGRGAVKLLDIATGKEIKTFKLDYQWLRHFRFSPDGKTIALMSGEDTEVTLLDTTLGKKAKTLTLKGNSETLNSLSFSPDYKNIASGSHNGAVKLWDGITGEQIKTLNKHSQGVISASFSPDGKTIAFPWGDNRIKTESISSEGTKIFKGHSGRVNSISFSTDGKTIVSGSYDGTVKLWDRASTKEIKTFKGHSEAVNSVSFSPDAKTIASGSSDGTVKLWDVTIGQEIKTFEDNFQSINSVSFSPNGKNIAFALSDNTVKIWDIVTGKEIANLKGHSKTVNNISFSLDGKNIASASADNTVKLWDVTTGQEMKTFKGHSQAVNSLSFSPDGKTIVSASDDKTLKVWDVLTGGEIKTLKEHMERVISVSFSLDGKTITSAESSGYFIPWYLDVTGKEIKMHMTYGEPYRHVNSVIFSPDGKTVASASVDGTIKLWDRLTGREIKTLEGHTEGVTSLSFSSDSTIIVSASYDKQVKIWDATTGKELKTLEGHSDAVTNVSFSPNGKTIASVSRDKTVKLWDFATGKEIKSLQGHSNWVTSISFSPDGKTIASASDDKTVKLWNSSTGKVIKTFQGHSHRVTSASFSPDGKHIISASTDNTVKIWDITTGREITTLKVSHSIESNSVSFSPDGKTIASVSHDGTVILWNFDLESLLGEGCNLIRDYLQNHPDVSEDDKRLCNGIASNPNNETLNSQKNWNLD